MAEAKKPSPVIVGRQFIKKYYERLDSQPETMHRFYQVDSPSLLLCLFYGRWTVEVQGAF